MAEHDILPSNSMKSRTREAEQEPPKRVHLKPVAHRSIGTKKDTTGQKFIKLFLAEDVNDVGKYLVNDLIIPEIKDIFLNFMYAVLWGERRSGSFARSDSRQSKNYNRISTDAARVRNRSDRDRSDDSASMRRKFNLDDIFFSNVEYANPKLAADEVKRQLIDYCYEYGRCPVAVLYELMEESGDYTAEYYGWTNLNEDNVRVLRARNGYSLDLPRPIRLER